MRRKKRSPIRECPLCQKKSMSLSVNGFCDCVASEGDWDTKIMILNGLPTSIRIIRESNKIAIRQRYENQIPKIDNESIKRKMTNKASIRRTKKSPRKIEEVACDGYSKKKRDAFLASDKWRKLRFETLSKYRKCLLCGSKEELHCDHIKPMFHFWELRDDPDNLQILCKECNFGKGISSADFRS